MFAHSRVFITIPSPGYLYHGKQHNFQK